MRLGPWLVIRGLILGNVIVVLLTSALSANASSPNPSSVIDAIPVAEKTVAESTVSTEGCLVSQEFPESVRQWCSLITRYAGEHGLPADLVAAVIWQESGGKPQAISRSGAVGLMQIMPRDGIAATFMCINGPCFSGRPSSDQLRDPEFNVQYGTRMLARLLERNGSLRDALKAYGPMDRGYSYADRVLSLYRQYGQ